MREKVRTKMTTTSPAAVASFHFLLSSVKRERHSPDNFPRREKKRKREKLLFGKISVQWYHQIFLLIQ